MKTYVEYLYTQMRKYNSSMISNEINAITKIYQLNSTQYRTNYNITKKPQQFVDIKRASQTVNAQSML